LFEAHEYARSMTYDYTRGRQTPTALLNLSGTDPIILKGKITAPSGPLLFADSDRFRDLQLAVNGESKGTLWNPKQLAPGRVRLTLVDPRNPTAPLMDHHVFLKSDTSYPVSELFSRQPTTGLEMRGHVLPFVLAGFTTQDFVLPEVYARFTEIMGTSFWFGFGGGIRDLVGEMPLAYETAAVSVSIAHVRIDAGRTFYPTESNAISIGLGLEWLSIKRVIDNEAFDSRAQRATLAYPSLVLDWRSLNLFGTAYGGIYTVMNPYRTTAITIDDVANPFRPITGGGLMGFTF